MKTYFKIFLLVFSTFFLFSYSEKPREIKADNYSGIIFDKHPFNRSASFMPAETEIHRLETLLEKRLVAVFGSDSDMSQESYVFKTKIIEDLTKYKRRYFGIINTVKKKIIYVEFVHPDIIKNDSWKSPKWGMDGGGHLFWSIRFNTESELFYDLWINANI